MSLIIFCDQSILYRISQDLKHRFSLGIKCFLCVFGVLKCAILKSILIFKNCIVSPCKEQGRCHKFEGWGEMHWKGGGGVNTVKTLTLEKYGGA